MQLYIVRFLTFFILEIINDLNHFLSLAVFFNNFYACGWTKFDQNRFLTKKKCKKMFFRPKKFGTRKKWANNLLSIFVFKLKILRPPWRFWPHKMFDPLNYSSSRGLARFAHRWFRFAQPQRGSTLSPPPHFVTPKDL